MSFCGRFGGQASGVRRRIALLYALLVAANLGAWAWAALLFRQQPMLLGTALLAYGFGLRHAVDADHIAAIDNVTRKLMHEGKRPVGIGFWFACGHSTVVVLLAAVVAATAAAMTGRLAALREIGGVIGTGVSSLFLFAVAAMNCLILRQVWRNYRHVRAGGVYRDSGLESLSQKRGLFARLFRPLFRIIGASWHMLPLGFLFGLGFDTATEVTLIAITVTVGTAAVGFPLWAVLVLPFMFTCGMVLTDTSDGISMRWAYGWAFAKPIRKVYYNLTMTLISVLVAFVIGTIEILGVVVSEFGLSGGLFGFWDALNWINTAGGTGGLDVWGYVGLGIVALFVGCWLVAMLVYKVKRYEETGFAPPPEELGRAGGAGSVG